MKNAEALSIYVGIGRCTVFSGKPLDMRTDGRAPTLEAAKAEFEASWQEMARLGKARGAQLGMIPP